MNSKQITLPIFGETTPSATDCKEYPYIVELWKHPLIGLEFDLDVNFKTLDDAEIESASRALSDLEKLNAIGLAAINTDFHEGGEAEYYINEWNGNAFPEIFYGEELGEYLSGTDENAPIEERLLAKLRLVRFDVYAGSQDGFVTLDYAFGYDTQRGFRDDMLIVKLNEVYKVNEIVSEG